ncbi:MAG: hypothetical protein E5V89_17840 [Mesorhizobium sp.]|uniref:hypothetical protein n=1 Tax=Mesorhizobium sp. TaxID=1871066 RepID=UPI000FE9B57A|nr:hypothetical protein [Mesorhizobium sp.]RWD60247.1 MAG: hypothetical protein EOS36_21810 [Mesorhizobium sp.]RWE36164.1 MAG: hypothetical protein EOS79_26370 [Mesorhizobium sp.]TIV69669.1 MAG: hypothetical protein E5V89_17840 [Mesorhizobium sp.]
MALRIAHSVEIGMSRLLNAPWDVVGPDHGIRLSRREASTAYRPLFKAYLADLEETFDVASEIWEAGLDELVDGGLTVNQAITAQLDDAAAGPANHPAVVWLVREYWLRCVAVGETLPAADRIAPEVFLLQWVADEGHKEYVELLTAMPYWPIGLDENGRWC